MGIDDLVRKLVGGTILEVMVDDDTTTTGSAGALGVEQLRRIGLDAGLAAVGVTSAEPLEPARSVLPLRRSKGLAATMQFTYRNPDRSTDPTRLLRAARSLVVGILDYHRLEPGTEPSSRPAGRIARYSWRDFYRRLDDGLRAMADALEVAGHRAVVVADSNALVDRNAAWRAGLGWYGKNTNLLVPGGGSWYVIGSVVTDAVLEPSGRPVADGCGTCTTCLDDCPTGALVAPGVLDARRCIAWLVEAAEPIPVEYREAVGDWMYGCDICQEVCPPNRVTLRRRNPPPLEADGRASVDLRWVLEASDAELLAAYGRWYIADRDPDLLRRTALVVLGNVGDATDPVAGELVERYLHHTNPRLRAHAVWTARRLGLDDLAEHTRRDPDPDVRDEWAHDVEPVTAGTDRS
ncbi:MAG: tRNA epoxyqueuosine(34) reductase QueG [Acidimicrobiia bacterium]|nr:tRNA epoxyqueuosine(34) reductase QueG [Acidimicrobiia bacterium]